MASSHELSPKQYEQSDESHISSQPSQSHAIESTSVFKFVQKGRKVVRKFRRTEPDAPSSSHDFVAFKTNTRNITHGLQHAPGDKDLVRAHNFRAAQTRWRLSVPVNNVTEGSSIDPFASTVIPLNSSILSLLQYAKSSMIRGAYGHRLEILPRELRPMAHMYQSAQEYVFKHVLQHEYLIYPFLAAFSQRFNTLSSPTSSNSLQHPDWYLHQAIRAVRTAIMEKMDDASALSHISTGVCFLVCSTGIMFRCEETRIHIQAFMKFLPYLNTKDVIGYWKLDTIAALDILMSVALGQEPILRVATADPGPLPSSEKNLIRENLARAQYNESQAEMSAGTNIILRSPPNKVFLDLMQNPTQDLTFDLGSALEEALIANRLHPSMFGPLSKLLECLMVAKLIWRAPQQATKRDTQWLCRRSQAVLHELLSMTGSRKIPTSTSSGRYAEALRLTLIIVLTSALYRLHLSRSMQSGRLRNSLSIIVYDRFATTPRSILSDVSMTETDDGSDNEATRESDELLLWILFTGYWASAGTDDGVWFAEAIVNVSRQCIQLNDFSELESIMMRYLYSRTGQRYALTTIAAMIAGERVPSSEISSPSSRGTPASTVLNPRT